VAKMTGGAGDAKMFGGLGVRVRHYRLSLGTPAIKSLILPLRHL